MKKVFEWFEGKKRVIGITVLIANAALRAFASGLMTPEQFAVIDMIGSAIGGYGMYDAYKKGKLTNKIQTK